jgi:hypothetical protein
MRTSSAGRRVAFALALVSGLVGSPAVRAEIISVPSAAPAEPGDPLPPPTVLRGSPPATVKPVPVCPPGYTVTADYGCVAPNGGDYSEATPSYDYWPDYGFGYPFGGFFGFDRGTAHSHRLTRFHGSRGFHGKPGFRSTARFTPHGAGMGHIGGFGRR